MAIVPKDKVDFKLVRRSDFDIRLTFKDGNGNALNLNGYTVTGEVHNEERTTKYADISFAYTNRPNGIVDMSLTDDQTTTFTPDFVHYDVKLTQPNGKENVYIRGRFFVLEGYAA